MSGLEALGRKLCIIIIVQAIALKGGWKRGKRGGNRIKAAALLPSKRQWSTWHASSTSSFVSSIFRSSARQAGVAALGPACKKYRHRACKLRQAVSENAILISPPRQRNQWRGVKAASAKSSGKPHLAEVKLCGEINILRKACRRRMRIIEVIARESPSIALMSKIGMLEENPSRA